jgi:8-oxo-dGTP pyrophosphatase MutT (NUDIX family)
MIRALGKVGQRTKGVPGKQRGERRGRQCAALPIARDKGELKVLLVTSRETQRWVLPKGWTEKRLSPHALAAKEAFEEAGVLGEVERRPIGRYRYLKRGPRDRVTPCSVRVFPLHVVRLLDDWPERRERQRRWFSAAEAAMAVEEGGLVTLLLGLATPHADAVRGPADSAQGDALQGGSDNGAQPLADGHGEVHGAADLVADEAGAEGFRRHADQDGEESQRREAPEGDSGGTHRGLAAASPERQQIGWRRAR